MSTPFISICIPTYNRPQDLKECLESILSQESFERGDIEIIIFDDASKDDIPSLIKPYQERAPTLRYYRNATNVRADRNIFNLLQHFNGAYFFGITDDDSLLPGALMQLRKEIADHPETTIFLNALAVYPEGETTSTVYQLLPHSQLVTKAEMEHLVTLFNSTHVFSQICLKREAVDVAGYERHIGTMYPHMHTTGSALLKGSAYYSNHPLIKHTSGNAVYWKYPDDYMLRGKIAIIKDLASIDQNFYKAAMKPLVENISNIVIQSLGVSKKKFLRFLLALIQIPQLRWRFDVWEQVTIPLARIVRFKVHTALKQVAS